MPTHDWQKSSFSAEAANCLYVTSITDGVIRIRESETPEMILTTTPKNLHAFILGIKAGEFDHFIEA